jgi:hypothetical protein
MPTGVLKNWPADRGIVLPPDDNNVTVKNWSPVSPERERHDVVQITQFWILGRLRVATSPKVGHLASFYLA